MSALLKSFCEQGDEALQLNHTSLWDCQETAHTSSPSERLNVLAIHGPAVPLTWLDRMGYSLISRCSQWGRPLNALRLRAQQIQQLASLHAQDSDESLRDHLRELAMDCRGANGPSLHPRSGEDAKRTPEQMTCHALAGVILAVERIHGFCPHQEQIMGALVLLDGKMAEMATGEGKTLTAAMAAIVAAWRGLPCHVVTANEYLAQRDAELGQPLYAFCHVSAASVDGEMQPPQRAAAYAHDVVFCTAQQLLGDYLRDGLVLGAQPSRSRFALDAARQGERSQGVVMRGMWQLIIDEADSVLIDEAVTPLIIAAQQPDSFLEQAARDAAVLASRLQENMDYKMQIALRHIELTVVGRERLSALIQDFPPFWRQHERACELVQMAL
jgi:preprotein translocase subunit SecA